ncbi:cardiolipin synthetase [compost metagenome]
MISLPEIVVPIALRHTQQATLTAPWFVQYTEYPPALATFEPLINGEDTFKAVYEAIAAAEKSVDIICWGFQPSMYFIREAGHPGSELNIGQLLEQKAALGVQVRILGWKAPFNSAGLAGEANLPGASPALKHRAGQTASDEQHAFDHHWFKQYSVAGDQAARSADAGKPLFVNRGFSLSERAEIFREAGQGSLDRGLSTRSRLAMAGAPTHHQKCVLVDYALPHKAVGFVMGHNMLDEYWDTNAHSARHRFGAQQPAPNRGPRGATPRQDISSRVSGPILEHLHLNFAIAWEEQTGEDLLTSRQAIQVAEHLQCAETGTPLLAQILRTQPQAGRRDIESLYLQAVNNATQLIYLENQYLRWPPLADAIKKAAADQTSWGRDPGLHGALHLFVVTNVDDASVGPGTVNTQRMLESLGRADAIPKVTALLRIAHMRKDMPPRPVPDGPKDVSGQRELTKWKRELDQRTQAIEDETLAPEAIPGLKVHVCSLVAPDSFPGMPWVPVYVHSKLMIVNDVFTTLGSANINTRSMQVDSELNIAHEWGSVTKKLRKELFELHTGGKGAQEDPEEAFDMWEEIIAENNKRKLDQVIPHAPIIGFDYDKSILSNLD